MQPMRSYAWFMLLRVCLWFTVLLHSSVAVPNPYKNRLKKFRRWKNQCRCSCLPDISTLLTDCITKEAFTIDNQNKLHNNSNIPQLSKNQSIELVCPRPRRRQDPEKNNLQYILLDLSCKGERRYTIYKETPFPKPVLANLEKSSTVDTQPTTHQPNQEESKDGKGETTNKLVIGLSIGLGLMAAIIVGWTWIRCRRKKAKKNRDEKEQNPAFGYIDEEEDSAPYRIVDLQTNISCDASGYTFLEARKQDEENPYMKLQPKCSRVQNKEHTEEATDSFGEVVDDEEEDERPYQTLLPPTCGTVDNKDCTETKDFEEIADEPVYFMLEAKKNSTTS